VPHVSLWVQGVVEGQQRVPSPLPQALVPGGHPQKPLALSMQATPPTQQDVPQGVWPGQQQVIDALSEHVLPLGQHPVPQATLLAGPHAHLPVLGLMHC